MRKFIYIQNDCPASIVGDGHLAMEIIPADDIRKVYRFIVDDPTDYIIAVEFDRRGIRNPITFYERKQGFADYLERFDELKRALCQ